MRFFLGSSFKGKWSSNGYQPYFAQRGFGFDDYVRGYEYYVVDGQDFWLSKTVLKSDCEPRRINLLIVFGTGNNFTMCFESRGDEKTL